MTTILNTNLKINNLTINFSTKRPPTSTILDGTPKIKWNQLCSKQQEEILNLYYTTKYINHYLKGSNDLTEEMFKQHDIIYTDSQTGEILYEIIH